MLFVQPVAAFLPRILRKGFRIGKSAHDKILIEIFVNGGLTQENEHAYRKVERTFFPGWNLEKAACVAIPLNGRKADEYTRGFLCYLYVPSKNLEGLTAKLKQSGFQEQSY